MINIRYAAAAMLLVGSTALASAQQTTRPQRAGSMRAHGQRGMRSELGSHGLRGQLFTGITLSDVEKANLKAVHEKYAPQMKALRDQFKPQPGTVRDAHQRADTAALRELRQKSAAQREQTKQLLLAQRNELRAALTPANQAKFDANVGALEKRAAERGNGVAKHGGRRPPRPGPAIR